MGRQEGHNARQLHWGSVIGQEGGGAPAGKIVFIISTSHRTRAGMYFRLLTHPATILIDLHARASPMV